MLDNTPNQPSRCTTKIWLEINDDSGETYNTNSQIKSKISILKSSLCDYSKAYIPFKGNITISNTADAAVAANNAHKKVISKHCVPFIDCINKVNNMQVANAKDIDVVMLMSNLIKYSDDYSKHLELYDNTVEINQL